jgi:hypothetical protein
MQDAADRLLGGFDSATRSSSIKDDMADDEAARLFGDFGGSSVRVSTGGKRQSGSFSSSSMVDYGDSPLTAMMPIEEEEMGGDVSMSDERPLAAPVASSTVPPAAPPKGGLGALLSASIKPKKPKKTVSINE